MKNALFSPLIAAVLCTTPALAASLTIYPVQTGTEQARYRLGVPTLTAVSQTGSVQITPVEFDHGNASFGIAVFNQSGMPSNFGVENVSVASEGQQLPLFTRAQLQQKAQNRATWAKIGTGVVTALASSAAAQEHNTYVSSFRAPGISAVAVYKDYTPGAIAQAQVLAAGGHAYAAIQQRLDFTLDHLAQDIVQTTTVDPGAAYGGRIVIARNSKLQLPYDLHVVVVWNGTQYPFTFRVSKTGQDVPPPFSGTPMPVAAATPVAPPPVSPPATSAPTSGSLSRANYVPGTVKSTLAVATPSLPDSLAASYTPPITASLPASAPQNEVAMPLDPKAAYEAGREMAAAQLAIRDPGGQN